MTKGKIVFLFLVIVFLSLIFFGLNFDFFTIKQIRIEENKLDCTNDEKLKNTSGLLRQNFFLLDSEKSIKKLKEEFICIKDINISRLFPNGLRIKVFSREPAAIFIALKDKEATSSSYVDNIATPSAEQIKDSYVVDNEGVTFSKDIEGLNIPRVYISKLENDSIKKSLMVLDKIKSLGVEAKESLIENASLIINPFGGEPKIIFRLDGKIDIQIASLQLILDKAKIDFSKLEFIDLRFDKPVVKFAPKKNG